MEINMAKKRYPADILKQIQAAVEAWKKIDAELKIGNLSQVDLEAVLKQGRQIGVEIDAAEARLTELRNQRDEVLGTGWEMLKRLRAGVKGIYGDDSSQYEMIGGTRMSERKVRTRKKPASSPAT
jgi:hypothetical protein